MSDLRPPSPASRLPPRRVLAALAAVVALGTFLRLPTFARPLLSDDEAIYAATADAMSRGALLYRDAVDHKPPLIYFIYRAGFAIFGPFDTTGAHLAVVLAVLGTALALFALARRGPGGDRAGVIAAGLFLVFSTTWHDYDALAANCELFLLLPQATAAWLCARARPDTGRGRFAGLHLAIGVLIGLAALCKYQGLTFLGVSAVLALVAAGRARGGLSARVGMGALALAAEAVGVALPIAAYVALAHRDGSLPAALDWFRFNFLYVGAGLSGLEALARGLKRLGLIGAMALPAYLLGLAGAVGIARRLRTASAVELIGLVWLLTGTIALCAGGRFFGHYFHLVLAPLAVLAAPGVLRVWAWGRMARAALVATTALPALLFFLFATVARPFAQAIDETEPPYAPVAARIAELSAPDERMFVWGNSPQLYVLAGRTMGTRFSFCNYMTGESPGTPTETGARDAATNSHAPAWQMLFADLDQRRPAIFVDAAAAGWDGYGKYPLGRYPALATYLAAHYRLVATIAGVHIHRRRP